MTYFRGEDEEGGSLTLFFPLDMAYGISNLGCNIKELRTQMKQHTASTVNSTSIQIRFLQASRNSSLF